MKLGKLTEEMAVELADYLKDDVYAERNQEFEEDEEFYELNYKKRLRIPRQFKQDILILPTARDMVDVFCNNTCIDFASVKAGRKGPQEKSEDEQLTEKHFAQGIMYMTNLEGEVSPWWSVNKDFWMLGMGVMKVVYAADLWPNKPKRKKNESEKAYNKRIAEWLGDTGKTLPIKIVCLHPSIVFPDPDTRSCDFVVEINEYHYMKAKMKYPFWENPKGRNGNNPLVRHISLWTEEQHMELIDGESILHDEEEKTLILDEHGYGMMPYVIFNSGLGHRDSKNSKAKEYCGVIRPVRDLLVAESSSFSVNHVVLKKAAWPGAIIKGPNAAKVKIKQDYGVYQPLPEGIEIQEYQHQTPPSEALQHVMLMHELIGEHGAPRTMQGQGEEGVRSGSDRRLLAALGEKKVANAEATFRNRTSKVLELAARVFVNKVPDNIRVWSRDASPSFDEIIDKKKMKEPFNYMVEFSPVAFEDRYRRNDDIIRRNSAGLIDKTRAWEEMPGIDPDDMEERMERERFMNDPLINQAFSEIGYQLAMAAMQKRLGGNAVQDMMAQQKMSGGLVGPNGEPIATMGPMGQMTPTAQLPEMPGSPEQLQRQLEQNRSGTGMNAYQGFGGGGERGANR